MPVKKKATTKKVTKKTTKVKTKKKVEKSKNPGWCLSQIKGLGPSGVLPLESSRKVSMNAESFSPHSPIFVPIV